VSLTQWMLAGYSVGLIGVVVCLAVFRRTVHRVMGIIVAVAVAAAMLFLGFARYRGLSVLSGPTPPGPTPPFYENPSFVALCLFASMTLGMCAKAVWDAAESAQPRQPLRLNYRSMLVPVLVAPIVFISVIRAVGEGNLDALRLCFGFQNGFFWQTVLSRKARAAGG